METRDVSFRKDKKFIVPLRLRKSNKRYVIAYETFGWLIEPIVAVTRAMIEKLFMFFGLFYRKYHQMHDF